MYTLEIKPSGKQFTWKEWNKADVIKEAMFALAKDQEETILYKTVNGRKRTFRKHIRVSDKIYMINRSGKRYCPHLSMLLNAIVRIL